MAQKKCDRLAVMISNPHQDDISQELLADILRQAGITKEEWEAA